MSSSVDRASHNARYLVSDKYMLVINCGTVE